MIIPAAYASRRNFATAYTAGYRAGSIADLGGVPLAPYQKSRMVGVFEKGFHDGQRAKVELIGVDLAGPGLVDATAYTFHHLRPTPRERELLAMLESIHKQIADMLRLA